MKEDLVKQWMKKYCSKCQRNPKCVPYREDMILCILTKLTKINEINEKESEKCQTKPVLVH